MSELHPLLRRASKGAVAATMQPAAEVLARALRSGLRSLGLLALVESADCGTAGSLGLALEDQQGSVAALIPLGAPAGAIAILLQPALVLAATEALLGGDGREPPYEPAPIRALTRIELRIARIVAEQAAHAIQACIDDQHNEEPSEAPRVLINTRCEKLETNLEFLDVGPQSGTVTVFALRIDLLGRQGSLVVVVPAALSSILAGPGPIRPASQTPARDPAWTDRLSAGLGQTDIRLGTRFEHHGLTLGDIAGLKVGAMLDLAGAGGTLIVESSGQPLFTGRLGQASGFYAVRIERPVDEGFQAGISE